MVVRRQFEASVVAWRRLAWLAPRAALVLALAVANVGGAQTVRLRVDPAELQRGDSAVLTWDAGDVTAVFISALGVVPPRGRAVIRPDRSTSYLLVAEGTGGVVTADA